MSDGLLEMARDYFQNRIAPQAARIDRDPIALQSALQGMGERCLLALRVPKEWGGGGMGGTHLSTIPNPRRSLFRRFNFSANPTPKRR